MPVRKVDDGFRWGKRGRTYPTKAQAKRQGRAIEASSTRRKTKGDKR